MSQGVSPVRLHQRTLSSAISNASSNTNSLQMMVDELDHDKKNKLRNEAALAPSNTMSPDRQSVRTLSAAPRLFVDDKDGVVDVELDLPGFMSFSSSTPARHPRLSQSKTRASLSRDKDDATYSLRSIPTKRAPIDDNDPVNVGGYLKKHHEDFILHAVKPYTDLLEDVKRSMRAEPTPSELKDQILQDGQVSSWVAVCTTLIADTKPFSIHRLTLRRQYEITAPKSASSCSPAPTPNGSVLHSRLLLRKEEITDELVMEFDTTLADAIEKILNVSGVDSTRTSAAGTPTDRSRVHSRNVSTSTTASTKATISSSAIPSTGMGAADHRDVVVGALEDVVRSVNSDLNRPGAQREDTATLQQNGRDGPKQENALREGVKRWMLNVEQTSTSVW